MYVKTTNGTVDTYPYSVGQLRRDNPKTSFPKKVPEAVLSAYGVYPVTFLEKPEIDIRTQKMRQETTPSLDGDAWVIKWVVSNKPPSEVQAYDDHAIAEVRRERDSMLLESDWTQLADAPVNAAAWATYRQALRDITDHVNFPRLNSADWPVQPD